MGALGVGLSRWSSQPPPISERTALSQPLQTCMGVQLLVQVLTMTVRAPGPAVLEEVQALHPDVVGIRAQRMGLCWSHGPESVSTMSMSRRPWSGMQGQQDVTSPDKGSFASGRGALRSPRLTDMAAHMWPCGHVVSALVLLPVDALLPVERERNV